MSAGVAYQNTDSKNADSSTSSVQERFNAAMNVNTRLSVKSYIDARLGFEVLSRKREGAKSTQLQPNITLQFSTKSLRLGAGYRQLLNDSTITTGTTTTTRTSSTSEAYGDVSLHVGELPSLRFRYLKRDQKEEDSTSGTTTTKNNVLGGSMNYNYKIVNLSADYSKSDTSNNKTDIDKTSVQVRGQIQVSKRFSKSVYMSLREDYLLGRNHDTSGIKGTSKDSTAEARLNLNPVARSSLRLGYIYRTQRTDKTILTGETVGKVDENRWFTSASYALPKMFRFYGSYSNRTLDTTTDFDAVAPAVSSYRTAKNKSDVTTLGVNFRQRFGRFALVSRYERRIDQTDNRITVNGVTTATDFRNIRDNIDWLITANLNRFMRCAVSEAYVLSTRQDGKSESNRYRLKLDLGPVMNIVASPYIDYVTNIQRPNDGPDKKNTKTELVLPVKYSISLRKKVKFDARDDYRITTTNNETGSTRRTSNNAIFRVTIPRLLKSLSASGDASFRTTSTEATSTSTSAYNIRLAWFLSPHSLSANVGYQTGRGLPVTTSFGAQYSLSLKLRKVYMSFSGSYSYTMTSGANVNKSSGQTIYLTLTLRN